MKQLLQQYAGYNFWANKRITTDVCQLPEEQIKKEIISSFPGIYQTIQHMANVESIWWQRLKLAEHVIQEDQNPEGAFTDLSKKLLQLSRQWLDWVSNANEVNIDHVFAYQNSKKELFKQPVYEVLLHLFNHQAYHRGQVVTMLRQSGVVKIAPTDFIVFIRKPLSLKER